MGEEAVQKTESISKKEMARRNLVISFVTKIAEIALSFIGRSFLIYYLGKFYLGVNGLFSGILQMLSLAEMGIGIAIIYRMYSPLANGDISKVRIYYRVYKVSYIIIGSIITVFGLCAIPLFPYLIKDYSSYSINLIPIYLIFLATTVFPYFLFSYKEALLVVHQETYVENIIFAVSSIVQYVIQIALLYWTKNYYVYLFASLFFAFLRHLIVSIIAKKKYSVCMEATKEHLEPSEKKSLLVDVVSLAMYNIGSVLMDSIDNIVISAILGIEIVGIYSNYFLITSSLSSILLTTFNSLIGTIGLYCATNVPVEEKKKMFLRTNYLVFICYGFCTVCCVSFFNIFINTWLGSEYVLPMADVALICLSFFLFGSIKAVAIYEQSFGLFRYGKFRPIVMFVVKVALSFALVYSLGLMGILLATVIAYLSTLVWWDPLVLYKYGFSEKPWSFYLKLLIETSLVAAFSAIAWLVCSKLPATGWPSTIGVLCVSLLFGLAFCVVSSIKSPEFSYFYSYMSKRLKSRHNVESHQQSSDVEIISISDETNQQRSREQGSGVKRSSYLLLAFLFIVVFAFFLVGVGGSGFSNSTTISSVFESITQLKRVIRGQQFYSAAFFLGSDYGAYFNEGIISPFSLILCLFSPAYYSYGLLLVSLLRSVAVYFSASWLMRLLFANKANAKTLSFIALCYSFLTVLYGLSQAVSVADFLIIVPLVSSLIIYLSKKQGGKISFLGIVLYLSLFCTFLWSSFYNLSITIVLFFFGLIAFFIEKKRTFSLFKYYAFILFLILSSMGISLIIWLPVLESCKSLSFTGTLSSNVVSGFLSLFGYYGLSFSDIPDSSVVVLCLPIIVPVVLFYMFTCKQKKIIFLIGLLLASFAGLASIIFAPISKLIFASSSFATVILAPISLLIVCEYVSSTHDATLYKRPTAWVMCFLLSLVYAVLFVVCLSKHFFNPFYILNIFMLVFTFGFISKDFGVPFIPKLNRLENFVFRGNSKATYTAIGMILLFCISAFTPSLFASKAYRENELSVINNLSASSSTSRFVSSDDKSYEIGVSSGLWPLKTKNKYFSNPNEASTLAKFGFDIDNGQYSTITAQSILGVECTIGFTNQFYEQRVKSSSFSMSYNPYCFPFAYRASPNIDNLKDSDNPFEYQSSIISLLSGVTDDVLTPCSTSLEQNVSRFSSSGSPIYISFLENTAGSVVVINGQDAFSVTGYSSYCVYSISQYLIQGDNSISFKKDGSYFSPKFLIYEEHLAVLKKAKSSITPLAVQIKSSNNIFIPEEQWAFQREQSRIVVGALYSEKWDVRYNGLQDKTIIHNSFGFISADVPYGHYYMRFVYTQSGVQSGYSLLMCSVPFIFVAFYYLFKNQDIAFIKDVDLTEDRRNVEVIEDDIRI